MHPELFEIFGFKIYTYGPIMALGFLLAFFFMFHIASKRGQDVDFFMDLYFWLILVGLLGAKLLYNVIEYKEFISLMNDKGLFKAVFHYMNCREGGLVWYGGVILDSLFIIWYCRWKKVDVLDVMDTLAAPLALGLAIGRWGCLMGGCCYGRPVAVTPGGGAPWWCITYPDGANPVAGLPVHPVPIYASIASLLIAGLIYWAIRHKVRRGVPAMLWFTLYPIDRYILEQFRGDRIRGFLYQSDSFYISTSQFIGIIFIILAVVGWTLVLRQPRAAAEAALPEAEAKRGKAKPNEESKPKKDST